MQSFAVLFEVRDDGLGSHEVLGHGIALGTEFTQLGNLGQGGSAVAGLLNGKVDFGQVNQT